MKISAIIPAYNAGKYLKRSVLCLIHQSQTIHEIIIIDDGSTDDTLSLVSDLQKTYRHIVLLRQTNQGASAARNAGLQKAQGDWILFLDADDECAPTLIEKYARYIEENPGRYCAVYSEAVQIDETCKSISEAFKGYGLHGQDGFVQMLLRNPIISPSGSLIKKAVLEEMSGFDTSIKYVEDVDLWLRVLLSGKNIGHVPEPLSYIRRHPSNTTSSMESTRQGEKVLLAKFGLQTLKKAVFKRDRLLEDNQLDYIRFLIRFEEWKEASILADELRPDPQSPQYISVLFTKALIALHNQNYSAAKVLYQSILQYQHAHGAALNNLAVLCAVDGDTEEAKTLLKRALLHYPGYLDAAYNLDKLGEASVQYKFTMRELRTSLLRYS
ncbi:glycosyltransferase [Paenibacillus sp. DXFW5]|uniref:Glycosyltransferase n=1 Tax=Paenibacillus rhizolycopersici TaxID=2780073 RepID=A0ABS2H755_9BACL|nr:glycosyltransferase [Paenibacillus rhizolycopersici]MBM6997255.1 glycosyltransferase [Paenibacillus rhizolycopersici]